MNKNKTPGQIFYEAYFPDDGHMWSECSTHERWEKGAAAVIAHYDPLYRLKSAHKQGKAIEFKLKTEDDTCWLPVASPLWHNNECDYRLAQPWTLPDPPAGRSWHRNDWTAEMLPDGWRPLLMDEAEQKEDQFFSQSCQEWIGNPANGGAGKKDQHRRTRRPLPTSPSLTLHLPPLRLTHGTNSYAHTTPC